MDFSGHAGRVIDNPREALSAAMEEAQAWRVRTFTHLCLCGTGSQWAFSWSGRRKRVWGGSGCQGYPDFHVPHCRRRPTIALACPPRVLARASVQVGDGLESLGWAASLLGAVSVVGVGRGKFPSLNDQHLLSSDPSHSSHPALVSWTHLPGGEPAVNWTAGPGGWVRGWAGLGWLTDPGISKTLEHLQPGIPGNAALSSQSVFLVRESQRNPQGFVLSLCHLQKVKHYLILPVSNSLTPNGGSCSPGIHDLKPHYAPPFSLYKKQGPPGSGGAYL